jgi:hypothetical protein
VGLNMSSIKPHETVEQYLIRRAFETGHFWGPENPEGWAIRHSDLSKLKLSDDVVFKALQSFSKSDVRLYARHVERAHGRAPTFDGQAGPALTAFAQTTRCPVPDHAPPKGVEFVFDDPDLTAIVKKMQADQEVAAAGVGNWQGCHDVGDFHCVHVRWDLSSKPSHLAGTVFTDVLKRVQKAYAQVGLLILFSGPSGDDLLTGDDLSSLRVNINANFVRSSNGWIGLAILGRTETCTTSPIWCRYLATYRGGNSREAVITQWVTLIMHEIGHNTGRNHTQGGVMNPSLVNGLPGYWAPTDPSTGWMKRQFGGVPVPIPGDGPGPKPPGPDKPDPDKDWEDELEQVRLQVILNEIKIDDLQRRVASLEDYNE